MANATHLVDFIPRIRFPMLFATAKTTLAGAALTTPQAVRQMVFPESVGNKTWPLPNCKRKIVRDYPDAGFVSETRDCSMGPDEKRHTPLTTSTSCAEQSLLDALC